MTDITNIDFNKKFAPLPFKIDVNHFYKKHFEVSSQTPFYYELSTNQKFSEKTFVITVVENTDVLLTGMLGEIQEYLKVIFQGKKNGTPYILFELNTEKLFSSSENFNLVLLEGNYSGVIEFTSTSGTRANNKSDIANSFNLMHIQHHHQACKSKVIFNFTDINNNPLSSPNGILGEDEELPVFFNYYNLSKFINSEEGIETNFLFNLSVPAKLNFYQNEAAKTLLKNNVMVNTVKNEFTNAESKIVTSYFHTIAEEQWRDDAFEVNHVVPNFHSEINYFALNKGKAASQVNTFIAPDAPRSKSHQHLKHILLGEATSFSKPNLMIENPDVESSHGNSFGSFNKEHMIYLKQRGLTEEQAKRTLTISAIEHACETEHFSDLIKQYFNLEANIIEKD